MRYVWSLLIAELIASFMRNNQSSAKMLKVGCGQLSDIGRCVLSVLCMLRIDSELFAETFVMIRRAHASPLRFSCSRVVQ